MISLLWFLAHADGSVSDQEKTSLSQIAPLLDEAYDTYAVDLATTCEARMAASAREFGAANAPKIEAGRTIDSMNTQELNGKLLCWNMLALADSDGIDEAEHPAGKGTDGRFPYSFRDTLRIPTDCRDAP